MNEDTTVERLLSHYRFWGIAAVFFFVVSVCLLAALALVPEASVEILYIALLCGFLWIGSTSFSRHSLVVLKRHIGQEMGMVEFLSTQLVALLFPFAYKKVKDEVKAFKEKKAIGNRQEARGKR
jgi:hypothetical protein